MEDLVTLGQIAEAIDVPPHRVAHVIRSRGIGHAQRAGIVRLYDRGVIDEVRSILDSFDRDLPNRRRTVQRREGANERMP